MTTRLPGPLDCVPLDLRDRPAWLKGVVLAMPGLVFVNEATGETLRLLEDGSLEPVLPGGRPGGICAHSTTRGSR